MNKQEFVLELKNRLAALGEEEISERVNFYSEIIDDKVEEGISEQEAVCELGNIDEIVSQILSEIPLTKLVRVKLKPKKRLSVLEIVLLVVGSPIWISLIISALAVAFSLYASAWAVIISLWSVFASFVGCSFASILGGVYFIVNGYLPTGIALIGAAILLAGLSILAFFAIKAITKGFLKSTKATILAVKNKFAKGEAAQ